MGHELKSFIREQELVPVSCELSDKVTDEAKGLVRY
jgi:hypothetical protein